MSKINLYQLTEKFFQLQEMMLDPDIDPQLIEDTMESMNFDYETKLEGYGKIIMNFQEILDAIDNEEKRLKARKKTITNEMNRLKNNMKNSMVALDKKRVRTPLFLFYVKSNADSLVVDNEDKIPEQFRIKQPDKIDTAALKAYVKGKGSLPYAHMEPSEPSLVIK